MEQDKPKRLIKWGVLTKGSFAVAFAVGCAGVDVYNNAIFGFEKSLPIAVAFIAAGVGLAALPFMSKGHRDYQVWGLVVVCALVSAFAGYKNHMASQRNHELAEKAITDRYNEARKAIEAAEKRYKAASAEVAGIAEQSGSAELQIALDAATKLYDDNKSSCGPVCKDARGKMQTLPERIGQAKAREDAQKRANEAWADMQAEKAKAPAQARAVSDNATEEAAMAALLIALTIIGATCLHRGFEDVHAGWQGEIVKPKKPMTLKKAEAVAVQAVAEKKNDIKAYIQNCLEPGTKATSSSDIYADFCAWWAMHNPGQKVPTTTMFGTAMGKAYSKSKSNGVWQYQAQIKAWRPAKPALEKVA